MLALNVLTDIEAILTSARVSFQGNEIAGVVNILNAIGNEKAQIAAAQRTTVAPPQPSPAPSAGNIEGS